MIFYRWVAAAWCVAFVLLTTTSYAQESTTDPSAPVGRIHIMVIDGGTPDSSHPWFVDANGRNILEPVDPHLINEGFQSALTPDGQRFISDNQLSDQQVLRHWSSRWHLAWKDSRTGQVIRKVTSWKIFSAVSLVVGILSQWLGYDGSAALDVLSSGIGWTTGSFILGFGGRLGLQYLPLGVHLVSRTMRRIPFIRVTDTPVEPIEEIPNIIRRANDMRHPTHVTGTLAGDDSPESKNQKTDLVIHTLSFDELGLSDKAFKIGPLRELASKAEEALDAGSGPRTAQAEAAVVDFLTSFFGLQKVFFNNLVAYIHDNNIRSVNMSYGADAFGIRAALAKFLSGRDAVQIAYGENVAEYLARLQRDSYAYLFKSCPNTKFFIAAGNDTLPVHRGNELFTEVDGPNVFVSGAADDLLRMADFSNYSGSRVDSFGLGVDRVSALPYGRTGKMSGTSMASPYNNALDLLLTRLNPTLTVEESMNILKKGSIKVQHMSFASESGGVSVAPLVIAQFLFQTLKKHGLLPTIEDLAPILVVHGLTPKKAPPGETAQENANIQSAIRQNARTLRDVVRRILTGESGTTLDFFSYEMARSADIATVLGAYASASVEDTQATHRTLKEDPNPFKITEKVIELLGTFLTEVSKGTATDDMHLQVSSALTELNTLQMQKQEPLIRYFITPDNPRFRGSHFTYQLDRLPITWDEFKENRLTPENLASRAVLYDIAEFLIHGQRLSLMQAEDLIDRLIKNRHRFNTLLFVGQYILKYSGVDLSIYNPARKAKETISEIMKRSSDAFPDPAIGYVCGN